MEVLKNI